jgi:hypothetical protein
MLLIMRSNDHLLKQVQNLHNIAKQKNSYLRNNKKKKKKKEVKRVQVKKVSLNMKTMKKLNVKCQDDACLMKTKRMMKLRRSFEVMMKYHKPKKKKH